MTENTKHLKPHTCYGPRIQAQLSWVARAQAHSWGWQCGRCSTAAEESTYEFTGLSVLLYDLSINCPTCSWHSSCWARDSLSHISKISLIMIAHRLLLTLFVRTWSTSPVFNQGDGVDRREYQETGTVGPCDNTTYELEWASDNTLIRTYLI